MTSDPIESSTSDQSICRPRPIRLAKLAIIFATLFGLASLFSIFISSFLGNVMSSSPMHPREYAAMNKAIVFDVAVLIACVFLWMLSQGLANGRARDTLSSSLLTLVIGLSVCLGAWLLLARSKHITALVSDFSFLCGFSLVFGGCMGLAGRNAYRKWIQSS